MESDAVIIARARALWPALTTAAASDALLSTWLPQARHFAGSAAWTPRLDALAHALAHFAYRVDPTGALGGGGSAGPVSSLSTLGLSATYAVRQARSDVDAEFQSTPPGRALLALRASIFAFRAPMSVR